MPYVKSIPIHSTVNQSIAYILNPDKTEDLLYTTSLNCLANAKDAYLAMKTVYEHFSGEKFNAPPPLKGKGRVKSEYENARQEVNALAAKHERLDSLIEQAETYFELLDKPDLSASEELRLKICRQTLKSNNISDSSDYDRLKAMQQETDKKIAALKNSFENCRKLYEVYADIVETYHNISNGDYISNLIAEKRREEEQQKQQTAVKKKKSRSR